MACLSLPGELVSAGPSGFWVALGVLSRTGLLGFGSSFAMGKATSVVLLFGWDFSALGLRVIVCDWVSSSELWLVDASSIVRKGS